LLYDIPAIQIEHVRHEEHLRARTAHLIAAGE
jgi:hypothetical protein